jgi:hypothetical protein
VVRVAEYGTHNRFMDAALAQDGRASLWVFIKSRVDLPIEIV